MKNPLLDKTFLKELNEHSSREVYAKIISLNKDEYPIEDISGRINQGTLSIDGTSTVRRTCSLTFIADRININDYNWGFNTKFKLFIGLKIPSDLKEKYAINSSIFNNNENTILINNNIIYLYKDYPDIVWFPQGLFLITNFKIIVNTNGTDNIYITGKDKMALLNGEIGGIFPHRTDVGTIEEYIYDDNGTILERNKTPLTLKTIIREVVHKYGNEPLYNINIYDLEDEGLQLIDYFGENDIYLLRNASTGLFENVLFDGDIIKYDFFNNPIKISEMKEEDYDIVNKEIINKTPKKIKSSINNLDNTFYTVTKKSYGSTIGYQLTEATYPSKNGELIINPGDTVTSVLDKICNLFEDEYEYFYDYLGRFIFQKKLIYLNTSWNNIIESTEETIDNILKKNLYTESSKIVSQTQYNFIGNKTTTMFQNNPNFSNIKNDFIIWGKLKTKLNSKENDIHLRYAIDEKPTEYTSFNYQLYTTNDYDWRELIYQMAVDYYNHSNDDDYSVKLYQLNPQYPFGYTGYEPYYTDLLEFWRQLYNPTSTDGDTFYIYDIEEKDKKYWRKTVFSDPSTLIFWFDFLEAKQTALGKYSVSAIGDRAKVVNDDNIKSIYYGEIPNFIFIEPEKYEDLQQKNLLQDGYEYILFNEKLEKYFNISKKNKSAKDELDQLLYKYTYCNDAITITSLPIYHLDVNQRISVFDNKTKINGEYIVNKLIIPLNYNGTMQIMATQAPNKLF